MDADEKPDRKTSRAEPRGFWRDGAWQAVGALAAIVALVVAILQLTADAAEQGAPGVQISGNCNPVGDGNVVEC